MNKQKIFLEDSRIESIDVIHSTSVMIRLYSPEIAKYAIPGQFVHTRVASTLNPLLRRPFSIQNVENDQIELLVKNYGKGSSFLLDKRIGDCVSNLGPLGNGWHVPEDVQIVVGVSGGVGVAPILFLQSQLKKKKIKFIHIIGAKSSNDIPIRQTLLNSNEISIATEDGSAGYKGTSIELFKKYLRMIQNENSYVVTCGPWKMMETLSSLAVEYHFKGEISAEARMGCAIGVCQGCAVENKPADNKIKSYSLCCKDGPIFPFSTINMEVNPFGN